MTMDEASLKELWKNIVLSEIIGSYQRRELILCDPADRRLKVCMYHEKNHHRPHVHIYWTKEYEVSISISDQEIIKRLIKRAKIEGRTDDADESIIKNRIDTYRNNNTPYHNH